MSGDGTRILGWGMIIAIMAGMAVVTGVTLGLMNVLFGLSPRWATGGVGAVVGVVGALLVAQRWAALERQKNR